MSSSGSSPSNHHTAPASSFYNNQVPPVQAQRSAEQLYNVNGSNRSLGGGSPQLTAPSMQRTNITSLPMGFSPPPGMKVCARCRKPCDPTSHIALRDGSAVHHACFTCDMCHKELPLKFALKHGKYYHAECYMIAKANAPRCQRCTEPILPGDVRVDTGQSGNFHGRCFVCDQCKGPLREGFMAMNNAFYHYECTVCSMCYTPLAGSNYSQLQEGGFVCDNCLYMHMQFQASQIAQSVAPAPASGANAHVTAATVVSLPPLGSAAQQPASEELPQQEQSQQSQQSQQQHSKLPLIQEKTYMKDEAWIPSGEATEASQQRTTTASPGATHAHKSSSASVSEPPAKDHQPSNVSAAEEPSAPNSQSQYQQSQSQDYPAEYQNHYYMQNWGNYSYQPAMGPMAPGQMPQQMPAAQQQYFANQMPLYNHRPSLNQYAPTVQNLYYSNGSNQAVPTEWNLYSSHGSYSGEYGQPQYNQAAATSEPAGNQPAAPENNVTDDMKRTI